MKRHIFNQNNKLLATIELDFISDETLEARNIRDKISKAYEIMLTEISVAENKYTDIIYHLIKP